MRWHNTSRIKNYFSEDIKQEVENYDPFNDLEVNKPKGFEKWSDLARSQYLEATVFMSGYLLSSQGDRMAMANSVEGRYPFLDHRIIEYAASLPSDFKLNGLNEKYILKEMMKGKIPDSILKRHKQAYRAPIHTSFFNENPPEYIEEMFSDKTISEYGYFDKSKVAKLKEKFKAGINISEVDNMALAGILSTQLIHSMFIQKSSLRSEKIEPDNLKVIRE